MSNRAVSSVPPSQRVCVFTAHCWPALHTAVSACYLMRVCTRVLPWVMTECIRAAALPLLTTSEGILRCRAALYHRERSAVVAGGGRMGITHRWPRSASNHSHTHLSHGASPQNNRDWRETYISQSVLVPTCLGQKRFCHSSIWWSSERWQESSILFKFEPRHWRANCYAGYACLK